MFVVYKNLEVKSKFWVGSYFSLIFGYIISVRSHILITIVRNMTLKIYKMSNLFLLFIFLWTFDMKVIKFVKFCPWKPAITCNRGKNENLLKAALVIYGSSSFIWINKNILRVKIPYWLCTIQRGGIRLYLETQFLDKGSPMGPWAYLAVGLPLWPL